MLGVEPAHIFVNVGQHAGRRLLRLPVKAEHGQFQLLIEVKRHVFASLRVAAHAMLRAVKRDQPHLGMRPEKFDHTVQLAVQAGRIGDEADALAPNQIQMLCKQHLHPQLHRLPRRSGLV